MKGCSVCGSSEEHFDGANCVDHLLERLRDAEARVGELKDALASGEASDGYHTHKELYEYRMLYNAHAAQGWLAMGVPVVKSWKHSDGDLCFGGGWFIVVATLKTGQVSNHYKEQYWDLFDVPVVELPPVYDNHTPKDAAFRLLTSLALTTTGAFDRLRNEVLEEAAKIADDHVIPGLAGQLAATRAFQFIIAEAIRAAKKENKP